MRFWKSESRCFGASEGGWKSRRSVRMPCSRPPGAGEVDGRSARARQAGHGAPARVRKASRHDCPRHQSRPPHRPSADVHGYQPASSESRTTSGSGWTIGQSPIPANARGDFRRPSLQRWKSRLCSVSYQIVAEGFEGRLCAYGRGRRCHIRAKFRSRARPRVEAFAPRLGFRALGLEFRCAASGGTASGGGEIDLAIRPGSVAKKHRRFPRFGHHFITVSFTSRIWYDVLFGFTNRGKGTPGDMPAAFRCRHQVWRQ
jgi:hypothetical protein